MWNPPIQRHYFIKFLTSNFMPASSVDLYVQHDARIINGPTETDIVLAWISCNYAENNSVDYASRPCVECTRYTISAYVCGIIHTPAVIFMEATSATDPAANFGKFGESAVFRFHEPRPPTPLLLILCHTFSNVIRVNLLMTKANDK